MLTKLVQPANELELILFKLVNLANSLNLTIFVLFWKIELLLSPRFDSERTLSTSSCRSIPSPSVSINLDTPKLLPLSSA